MKIVLATPIYPPEIGGPAIYSQRLKEGLEKMGHEINIVSYRDLRAYPQPLRIFVYFLKLLKSAKGCDLIYSFNLTSCGLPACCVSKILSTRFFVRIGGDFLWERAVEAGRTQKPLREYYEDSKTFKERFWIRLMKKVFNQAGRIIFTSGFQRNIYLKYFGVDEHKTVIIQNPFPEISLPADNAQDTKYQILYAGRLLKLKNLDFLIRVFHNVLLKTGKKLTLKIIGEGPESKNLKADKSIIFSPAISQQDLWKEIQQAYLCVLPSLTEITPNFALECLKLRKPILLTKETEYFETLKDDLIFIDPQNEIDLEDKIIYLLDEKNYFSYVEKIKRISTQRSWEDVIKEHEESFIHRSH
ncbi:MAG: glycosyltransferase family 4 protein [Candidatus Nealsonbacteria bacterium]